MSPLKALPANTLSTLYQVFEVIGGFVAFAFLVTFGMLVKRYSVFKFQGDAIKNLNEAYEGLDKRFGEEVECRKLLEKKVHDQEVIIAGLRGVVTGKDHAIEDVMRASVLAGGCDDALVCKLRKTPGEHILRASSTLSPGGTD